MKRLEKIAMFFTGNPKAPFPERIFFTYDVISGMAKKTNQLYEVPSFDPKETSTEIWNRSIKEIEEREGV